MGFKDLGDNPSETAKAGMSTEARSHHLSSWLETTSGDGEGRCGIRGSRHCARLPVVSHTRLYLEIMLSVLLWGLNTVGRVKFCIRLPKEEAAMPPPKKTLCEVLAGKSKATQRKP